jgi:hypothetical protein
MGKGIYLVRFGNGAVVIKNINNQLSPAGFQKPQTWYECRIRRWRTKATQAIDLTKYSLLKVAFPYELL